MLNLINRLVNANTTTPSVSILQSAAKPCNSIRPQSSTQAVFANTHTEKKAGKRKVKLIMVTDLNNNKFYDMEDNEDGTFTVFYGRIGSRSNSRNYPIQQWESKRREKLRKGYKDTTYLFAEKNETASFSDIKSPEIRNFVNNLMKYAQNSVQSNYRIASEEVSMQQITEAQNILDTLSASVHIEMDTSDFNWHLKELYAVIPRKMNNVRNYLIQTPNGKGDLAIIEEKLAKEQATLDVMRGQVEMHKKQENQQHNRTLLEAFGLHIEHVTEPELIYEIKKMMKDKSKHFRKAYKVINTQTQSKFERHIASAQNKRTELFWHGSRNENWLSILKTGLVLRPANAIINGKMFGYGLYFADKFSKSLNYSSLYGSYWSGGRANKGYLALYEVHTGQALKIKKHQPWCGQLNAENLYKRGRKYNSVFAEGGVDLINNEYIIYNENQCTVRYIIEIA